MKPDLNCDLGEGEPKEKTRALMRQISSVNIACGVHAGNEETMGIAVELALEFDVHVGVHPGLPGNFGRATTNLTSQEFGDLLIWQIEQLEQIIRHARGHLHHIKLHGALYHMTEENEELRKKYIRTVQQRWPGAIIFSRANGPVQRDAGEAGLEVWPEGFLDRGYRDDGSLAPRTDSNALLSRQQLFARLGSLLIDRTVETAAGYALALPAKTWCIHSDSPDSVTNAEMAKVIFSAFDLTLPEKRALLSELTERYEINAGSAKIRASLG